MSTWLIGIVALLALPLGLWLGSLCARLERRQMTRPISSIDAVRARNAELERELGLERYKLRIWRSHGRWQVCCYVDGGYHWGSDAATYEGARYEAAKHAKTRHGAEVDLRELWFQARESAGVGRDEAKAIAREEFRRRVVDPGRYVCGICGTRCPDCVRGSSDVVCHTCAACVRKRRSFERIRPQEVLANQRARSR